MENRCSHADPTAAHTPLPIPVVSVGEEPQWEYHRLVRNLRTEEAPTAAELNRLGDEGWELTAVLSDSPIVYFYFKRFM